MNSQFSALMLCPLNDRRQFFLSYYPAMSRVNTDIQELALNVALLPAFGYRQAQPCDRTVNL
ncbi:hypothetical protein QUB76_02670 [Microcoleus sp. D2B6]|uniref:hypothetical protein n=1 Tax=unclassified Microcoleus TaxID=2642155 RepID=UPI002FD2EE03